MFAVARIAALALTFAAARPDSVELKPDSLLKVLRHGGYTIVLRHARTDQTSKDEAGYSNSDRTTQRNLSGDGVADAKRIGRVMKAAGIPFSEIVASPMFRTMETAQMAFGPPVANALLRQEKETPDQRALFTAVPRPGTNRAIVTHHFLIEHYVPGIKPGAIAESEAVVIRPAPDGTILLVGRFKLADWSTLAGGDAPAAPVATFSHAGGGGSGVMAPPDGSPATVAPFDFTATPATKLAGLYLHSFNSGDAATMRKFIEASLVPNPDRPTEARMQTWQTLLAQHGTLTIVGTESASATQAVIRVRSKQGEFNLVVEVSPDPSRAASVRFEGRQ